MGTNSICLQYLLGHMEHLWVCWTVIMLVLNNNSLVHQYQAITGYKTSSTATRGKPAVSEIVRVPGMHVYYIKSKFKLTL